MADVRRKTGRWAGWDERLTEDERQYLVEYWQMKQAVKAAGIEARRIRTRAASRSKFNYQPRSLQDNVRPGSTE